MMQKDDLLTIIKVIHMHLDNIKYECASRMYTLDEDEMAWIFYCRDIAWGAMQDQEKK